MARSMDFGGGWIGSEGDEWVRNPDLGIEGMRPITAAEKQNLSTYFSSPEYINGKAMADSQRKSSGGLFGGGLGSLLGLGLGAYGLGSLAGLWGAGAGAGASGFGAGELLGGAESLSGLSAANSLSAAGLGGAAAGAADAAWGVNQATGGGMDWFDQLTQNYDPDAGFQLGSEFNNYTGEAMRDLSALPPPTNLQDVFVNAAKAAQMPVGTVKSLFDKFLSGDASALSVLGAAAPGLISEYFKSQQANNLSGSLSQIANQARADRSPFLDYAKSTLAGGPEAYAAGAGSQALKGVLAKLSAQFGNPIGAPAALGIATDSALNNWGNDWRQAANIGLGGNYSQLATNAATAGAGTSGAGFGDAAASVFTPQRSLTDILKQLQGSGMSLA